MPELSDPRLRPKNTAAHPCDAQQIRAALRRMHSRATCAGAIFTLLLLPGLVACLLLQESYVMVAAGAVAAVAAAGYAVEVRQAEQVLRRLPDSPRTVGLLAVEMEGLGGGAADRLARAMIPRLARMRAADLAGLSVDEQQSLDRLMVRSTWRTGLFSSGHSRSEIALQIAIVEMVRDCGDREALRVLRRAASAADTAKVRQAAEGAVVALNTRLGLLGPDLSLLRPADPPAGEGLLRPAQVVSETDAGQLLRPVDDRGGQP